MENKEQEPQKIIQNPIPITYQGSKIFELDEKNKICVDCQKEQAIYVSLNQGVTICEKCCEKHKLLGPEISSTRVIEGNWFEYPFKFIENGGNTKFLKFLEDNLIPLDKEPEVKYKCKAIDYYRRNLKAHVLYLGEIVKDYTKPLEIAEIKNVFPEFATVEQPKKQTFVEAIKEGGLKFTGFFKKIGEKAAEGAKNFGDVTKEGVKNIGNGLKKAGTFVEGAFDTVKEKITNKDKNTEEVKTQEPIKIDETNNNGGSK